MTYHAPHDSKRYGKAGNKNVQPGSTCLATCCETSSKAVLRRVLPPMNHQTCLATNHVVAGCANLMQEVKRVVLLFATKFVHVARFTGLLQTCLAASDVTPVWRDSRVILSNQRSVHAQLATTRFAVKTVRFETERTIPF